MSTKKIIIAIAVVLFAITLYSFIAKGFSSTSDEEMKPNNTATTTDNNTLQSGGTVYNLPIPDAVKNARKDTAIKLNVSETKITILEALEVEWPNSCLGVDEGKVCLQVITPGYKVVLTTGEQTLLYHTDKDGKNVIFVKYMEQESVIIN